MRTPAAISLVLLALAWAPGSKAQAPNATDLVHRYWGIEDGLPVNAVRDLAQTEDGFLWLATVEGLVRFDGVEFTIFNAGNSDGFPENRLLGLEVVPDGRLLIQMERGGVFVRNHDGAFGPLEIDGSKIKGRFPASPIVLKPEDGDVAVSVAQEEPWTPARRVEILLFSGRGTELLDLPPQVRAGPQGEPLEVVSWLRGRHLSMTYDAVRGARAWNGAVATPILTTDGERVRGKLFHPGRGEQAWVLSPDQRILRLEAGRLVPEPMQLPPWFLELDTWSCFWPFSDGRFFIGRNTDGLYLYEAGTVTQIDSGRIDDCKYLRDRQGNVWGGAPEVLLRNDRVLLRGTKTNALLEGKDGTVWAATEEGLHAFFPSELTMHTGIGDDNLYSVTEDAQGRIWTSSWGHPRAWVLADGRWLERPAEESHTAGLRTRDGRLILNRRWARTRSDRLPIERDWTLFEYNHKGGLTGALHEDAAGRIWLAAPGNDLWRFDTAGSHLVHSGAAFRTFLETNPGRLWAGSERRGIARIEAGTATFYGRDEGLASNSVRWLLADPEVESRLWVATEDNGLNRIDLDPASGDPVRIAHAGEAEGLFRNGLHAVLQDDFGRLWMNTNYGVFWVWKDDLNAVMDGSRARVESTVYTEREGLANREGNGGFGSAGLKSTDGHIWFPTQAGLAEFDPASLSDRPPARAAILGWSANGEAAGPVLKPEERDFTVRFTAPEFTAPERLRFEYRLVGYEDAWRETAGRSVSFTNLDPGSYTFEVRVRSRQNQAPAASAALTILPFWYETAWFKVLLAFGLAGLAVGSTRYSMRRARDRERRLNELVAARTAELRIEKETTERQAAELRELNQAKSRFFANISHEFRTPLTLIIGPLRQLLAREDQPDRPTHELMLRNADKLLGMVNRILELARLESKTLPYDPKPGDLAAHVRETALGLSAMAERNGITLVAGNDPARFALFDPSLIDRVVTNLLSNALKFTDEGGHVFVNVHAEGENAVIVVRDTGIGIAEDKLPFIFDRFYQTDTSSTRRHEGTGIGLSLVRELVHLHGGRVTVESREGHGSTFQVHLPMVPGEVAPVIPTIVADAEGDGLANAVHTEPVPAGTLDDDEEDRTTILLVDDNDDIRAFLRTTLQSDFRVVEAVDGRQALRSIEEGLLPDVVICDVMMPRMDGLEFNQRLKDEEETETIPFIFLTALADEEHRLQGALSGADLYLTKPIDPALLAAQVHGMLRRRGRLRELLGHAAPADEAAAHGPFESSLRQIVLERLADADLSAQDLADVVGLSYSQMHRRLKSEADLTPTELVRQVRLEQAVSLMERENCSISEAAYAVGFNSLSYFNRCFRAVYGTSPSAFRRQG